MDGPSVLRTENKKNTILLTMTLNYSTLPIVPILSLLVGVLLLRGSVVSSFLQIGELGVATMPAPPAVVCFNKCVFDMLPPTPVSRGGGGVVGFGEEGESNLPPSNPKLVRGLGGEEVVTSSPNWKLVWGLGLPLSPPSLPSLPSLLSLSPPGSDFFVFLSFFLFFFFFGW